MSTFMKNAILVSAIICGSLSADSQTSQDPKGMGRDPIVQEVKAFLENCESRIVARSEIEYGKRYAELKGTHDRFMISLQIIVALIGVAIAWFGIVEPKLSMAKMEKGIQKMTRDRAILLRQLSTLKQESSDIARQGEMAKGELYFQLARMGFAQYKVLKDIEILEIVVRDTIRAIAQNVKAGNARALKKCIVLINIVLNKPVADNSELSIPKELEQHRKAVEQRLKKYVWGFSMLDVQRVFEQGEVDDSQVGYSITNLEKIMGRFGI